MARRLIVDTNVLVAIERREPSVLDLLLDDDDLAVAAVTVAELLVGVELAPDETVAASRRRAVDAIVESVAVLDYSVTTAAHHAALLAHTRRAGSPRGAHDLTIAAHAAQTDRAVLTRDARARFGDLPGVRVA